MTAETNITPNVCQLHRDVIYAKIETLTQKDNALDRRMEGIENKIQEVFDLQRTILYVIIFIAVGTCLTLSGVLLGRGIDFGWLI
jgi:hypothetical protein